MAFLIFINSLLPYLSLLFAVISAVCWIVSSFVKSQTKPKRVELTFDDRESVDLHNLILTMDAQAQWNRWAALSAALAIICQSIPNTLF